MQPVYRHRDSSDFTSEALLESEARSHMPVLRARPVDPSDYAAPLGVIELRPADRRPWAGGSLLQPGVVPRTTTRRQHLARHAPRRHVEA